MQTINWGILGAARINQQLMPAIVQATNSKLHAIASRRPGAASQTLAQYAPDTPAKIYHDPQQLLQDPDIQAVYIPMATGEHSKWTRMAIEHGKNVLCEKPLALTVADIDTIAAAASQHGCRVMEGFMYRFHPQHQAIQQIITAGTIGEVRSVRSCFSYPMQPAREYRIADTIANGSGAMWDIGCYAIHALRLPYADACAKSVFAMATHTSSGADLSCCGVIDFADGKYGHFNFGFQQARRAEYEVIGSTGGIKCHNVWAKAADTPVISWWNSDGEFSKTLPCANHFVLEVEHFADCLLQNKPPMLTLADAADNCRIINAALASVRENKPFSVL